MSFEELQGILHFLQKAENLKNTLRSAYSTKGRQESSAEHSWRLCLFILVCARFFDDVSLEKLLKLAIVHDLGEAVVGDIPAPSQDSFYHKSRDERDGLDALCLDLPDDVRADILALWDEYEAAETKEAQLVKGLDKLETIMQHNQGKNPQDFDYAFNITYGQEYTRVHPLLRKIREKLDAKTRSHMALHGIASP